MKESTARTVRTCVQLLISLALAVPMVVPAIGLDTTVGLGATVLAAAAVITRLHQIPAVNDALNKYLKIPK